MTSNEQLLHAYHDGELSWLARWRFERRLRRSPALQAELERLERLRGLLQARDANEPAPDLWDAIALRLPAVDAQRAEAGLERGGREAGGSAVGLLWWLKPVGAVVATAAVAGIVLYGEFWQDAPTAAAGGVVRWIDSGGRSVMVLDDEPDTTIIWVFDGKNEGARIGGRRDEA